MWWHLKSPASQFFWSVLYRRRSRTTSNLHVTGLCVGNSPVTSEFPEKRASNTEVVSIWWLHHDVTVMSHYDIDRHSTDRHQTDNPHVTLAAQQQYGVYFQCFKKILSVFQKKIPRYRKHSEGHVALTIKLVPTQVMETTRQSSNIRCALVGNKIVDHSDVVGAALCSNYIFILDLILGFNIFPKGNCKTTW